MDVARDLKGGRGEKDQQDARNLLSTKFFKSLAYTVDGEWLIGGGTSKNICIYDLRHRVMVKKLVLNSNRSMDGLNQLLNSKNIKDGQNINEIDAESDASDKSDYEDNVLPGAKRPNYMKRGAKLKIEARQIKIEPGGRCLAVATTEGFMIFGVEDYLKSSAGKFSIASSKQELLDMIKLKDFSGLIVSALTIKDERMLKMFIKKTPVNSIEIVSQNLPTN